jgi:pyruvate-formate lyase
MESSDEVTSKKVKGNLVRKQVVEYLKLQAELIEAEQTLRVLRRRKTLLETGFPELKHSAGAMKVLLNRTVFEVSKGETTLQVVAKDSADAVKKAFPEAKPPGEGGKGKKRRTEEEDPKE